MKLYKILFAALVLSSTVNIYGQASGSIGASDARSASMGGISNESALGLYALGNNPANLLWDSGKHVELIVPLPLPKISATVGANFMTLDDYNYFFGSQGKDQNGKNIGRTLTDADKTRLQSLFSDGGSVTTNAQIQLFAISIKPNEKLGVIAFSISDVISSNLTFPKEIVDLGMQGNLPNKVYNFNDTKMKSWWLRKFAISYAHNLNFIPVFKSVSLGISFNIINGYAYAGIDHVNTELTTGTNNVITGKGDFLAYAAFSPDLNVKYDFDSTTQKKDFKFVPFPTPAGSGLGVDFGFSAKLNDVWSFGVAVTDIGSVKWNKNVAAYSSNQPIYLDDLSSQSQRDSLQKALTGKNSGKYINEISTQLATAFRFGAAFQLDQFLSGNFPGKMLLAFDYNQGFNDQPGNSTKPRLSIGADWGLGVIALRTGFSFGGFAGFTWGMGVGFDFKFLELNLGTSAMQSAIAQNSTKRISVAIDSRWKF